MKTLRTANPANKAGICCVSLQYMSPARAARQRSDRPTRPTGQRPSSTVAPRERFLRGEDGTEPYRSREERHEAASDHGRLANAPLRSSPATTAPVATQQSSPSFRVSKRNLYICPLPISSRASLATVTWSRHRGFCSHALRGLQCMIRIAHLSPSSRVHRPFGSASATFITLLVNYYSVRLPRQICPQR